MIKGKFVFLNLLWMLFLLPQWSAGQADQQPPRFGVESQIVPVPVVVVDKEGKLYTELPQESFTVLEDGVEQQIISFNSGEEPLTTVLLLEYSQVIRYIRGEVLRPAGVWITQIMGMDDFAAIASFDMRPHLHTDFTRNQQELLNAVNILVRSAPGFRDSALFDALAFILAGGELENVEYKGIAEVKGRTGVILIATGMNTFSKRNFDEARKLVANSGVPVYSIGIGELAYMRAEPYLSGIQRMSFLQAQNTLRTFSQESGGRFYKVRFQGALHGVLDSIAKMLRFQYTLGYVPQGKTGSGKKEIKVLVDIDGDGRADTDRLDLRHRKFRYVPESGE